MRRPKTRKEPKELQQRLFAFSIRASVTGAILTLHCPRCLGAASPTNRDRACLRAMGIRPATPRCLPSVSMAILTARPRRTWERAKRRAVEKRPPPCQDRGGNPESSPPRHADIIRCPCECATPGCASNGMLILIPPPRCHRAGAAFVLESSVGSPIASTGHIPARHGLAKPQA